MLSFLKAIFRLAYKTNEIRLKKKDFILTYGIEKRFFSPNLSLSAFSLIYLDGQGPYEIDMLLGAL